MVWTVRLSFDLLAENNRKQMQGLIEELAAKKSEPGKVLPGKIGDLYNIWLAGYRQAQWRRKYSYPAGIGKK